MIGTWSFSSFGGQLDKLFLCYTVNQLIVIGTMFTIDIYSILPLTCALFVLLFGAFILARNPRSTIHQLLTGFCASMFFWMFGTFMMFGLRGTDVDAAIFWDRFVYLGVVFMPPLMHHFSLVFMKRKSQKFLLSLNYLSAMVFMFASRTDLFVQDLYHYDWGAHTQARILHHVFLVYFFIGTGVFFYNMLQHYYAVKKYKQKRLQTVYSLVAFAIVIFVGGSAYLHAYGIDTRLPFAYLSGVIFPVLLFYAATRYHLLGTKVIATEVLIGIAFFALVAEMFLARSPKELALRAVVTIVMAAIGYLLIKSVQLEIRRREEFTHLAHSLERANERLKELDRQKTEFLSIASHQLRTPLSIIKGYIELIKDGAYGKAPRKMKTILAEMDQSNERLVKLVDNFLNISRIEQGRTKYVFEVDSINGLIDSVVHELEERATNKGLKLRWKRTRQIDKVYMDSEKMRHVIFNFVDNAIKYSEKGSISIVLTRVGRGAAVRVVDKGIGFNKEDEGSFFNKFYRGKNVEGTNVNGTGLGIYVCRQFAEAHGGHVWAHSKGLGKGSEFGVWIPEHKTRAHAKALMQGKGKKQRIVNQYEQGKKTVKKPRRKAVKKGNR